MCLSMCLSVCLSVSDFECGRSRADSHLESFRGEGTRRRLFESIGGGCERPRNSIEDRFTTGKCVRERDREGEREREIERERQGGRERNTEREKGKDMERGKEIDRSRERHRVRKEKI